MRSVATSCARETRPGPHQEETRTGPRDQESGGAARGEWLWNHLGDPTHASCSSLSPALLIRPLLRRLSRKWEAVAANCNDLAVVVKQTIEGGAA
jgi:hypothetical protein